MYENQVAQNLHLVSPPPPFGYPHADLRFSLKLFQIAAEAYSNTQFRDLILPVCIHYASCTHPLHGPRSAVGNVSGYRCESDCRSRGREFDPGPVPYFRGD